jgi:hypothetical protein
MEVLECRSSIALGCDNLGLRVEVGLNLRREACWRVWRTVFKASFTAGLGLSIGEGWRRVAGV